MLLAETYSRYGAGLVAYLLANDVASCGLFWKPPSTSREVVPIWLRSIRCCHSFMLTSKKMVMCCNVAPRVQLPLTVSRSGAMSCLARVTVHFLSMSCSAGVRAQCALLFHRLRSLRHRLSLPVAARLACVVGDLHVDLALTSATLTDWLTDAEGTMVCADILHALGALVGPLTCQRRSITKVTCPLL